MPAHATALATSDEIRAIHRRAIDMIDEILEREDEDYDPDQHRIDNRRLNAAVEALRFCCIAAGELGDVALLPLVAEAIDERERFDDHVDSHASAMSYALTQLLRAGAPVGPELKELAEHTDARVRTAVASGLRPRGEREIELLEALATDPIPDVRGAAREALSKVREVAWWKGKFASDPVARLSPEEAIALKPVLEQLSALLDKPRYEIGRQEATLCELASALPDPLLIELTETIDGAVDPYGTRFPSLVTTMLERPGGLDAFKRLCGVWCEDRSTSLSAGRLAVMVAALPHERRVAACKELAAHAAAFPSGERQRLLESPARMIAEIAAEAWPPGEDLTPLLDLVLSIPDDEHSDGLDYVVAALVEAFRSKGAQPGPFLERAIEARLAGYPGTWSRLKEVMDRLFERADGQALRPAAERAILSDDEDNIGWGLHQLLGPVYDPARDAPPEEMLERFLEEPRYRKVILKTTSLCRRAVGFLRAELRTGRLRLAEARTTLEVLGELYGGVAVAAFSSRRLRRAEEVEAMRAKRRVDVEDYLGAPDLRGPPTAEEWATLRALRSPRGAMTDEEVEENLRVLPDGPWCAEDRALLDEALRRLREGSRDLAAGLAMALSGKASEDTLPIFDELLERAEPNAQRLVRLFRGNMREVLGLPRKPEAATDTPEEGAGAKEAEVAWMDQDDDD
jgi:hypothetical protein